MSSLSHVQIIERFNAKLAPHNVKVQDMTLVVERAIKEQRPELIKSVNLFTVKDTSRAIIIFNTPIIIFNTPGTRAYLPLNVQHGDGPWQFIHSDNFYVPTPSISLDKQIDQSIRLVTGGEECCICMEEIIYDKACDCLQLDCGHVFHLSCMDASLMAGNTDCPLCRSPVVGPFWNGNLYYSCVNLFAASGCRTVR